MFDDPSATQDRLPTTPVECKIDLITLPVGIAPFKCRVVEFDHLQQSVVERLSISFGHAQRGHK